MPYAHVVSPGKNVSLDDIDPGEKGGLDKAAAQAKTEELATEISELQDLLYAAGKHSLLIVFQGRDTSGKDGAINRILRYVNVQSTKVAAFKQPSPLELGHDFLWRIHAQTPARGGISIFNRSHYEDVLVVRVHDLVPKPVWQARFDQINEFERLLLGANTIVLKFYLHISKSEQQERLLEREKDPTKAWKLAVGDWQEREYWSDYTKAYEDALSRCSTEQAPWQIVPADHKWFRDLAVAEAISAALRPHRKEWEADLVTVGEAAKAELAKYRASAKSS